MQAENDIQQALDLLSSPMCNAALQQALVASSVDPQGPSLPPELPPAVYQPHGAHARQVGLKIDDAKHRIEAHRHTWPMQSKSAFLITVYTCQKC